jgi:hypothetical protein
MRYIVLIDDVYGRAGFGTTDDPVEFLARRVAEDKLSIKAAQAAPVFQVQPCDVDPEVLRQRVERMRLLFRARDNRLTVLDLLAKKKLDETGLDALRAEMVETFPLGDWSPPWPRTED